MPGAKKIPFSFVLDLLFPIDMVIKPMFGCHAIYVKEKMMLMLRDRKDHEDANGIWFATSKVHHASLKKQFPSMTSVMILSNGKNETEWQMIHADDENFENYVTQLCEMIKKKDERIGKIPKRARSTKIVRKSTKSR